MLFSEMTSILFQDYTIIKTKIVIKKNNREVATGALKNIF